VERGGGGEGKGAEEGGEGEGGEEGGGRGAMSDQPCSHNVEVTTCDLRGPSFLTQ